jgi:hypothetical protein
MTASQAKEETLRQYMEGVERLENAIAGLSAANLDIADKPGEWTIRQMVHHVADDGDAWSMPLKKAIAISGAPIRLEGFPGNDAWATAMDFDKREIVNSMALIKAHQQVMDELARYFITFWDSRYIAILDERGQEVQRVTVGQIIGMVTEHMIEHVTAIENIKQRHGI